MARLGWKRLKFVPILFLAVLGFALIDYAIRGPKAKTKQSIIENEFRAISDPQSSSVTSSSGFKTGGGYVNRILQTDLAPAEVESYYRGRLEEQKRFYLKEEVIQSNRRAIFCNGTDEAAVLTLPERVIQKQYEYSLTITWNNMEGCN